MPICLSRQWSRPRHQDPEAVRENMQSFDGKLDQALFEVVGRHGSPPDLYQRNSSDRGAILQRPCDDSPFANVLGLQELARQRDDRVIL